MKINRRLLTLVIALSILTAAFCSPVFATETTLPNQVLGTTANETGALLADNPSSAPVQPTFLPTFTYTEMFSMTANQVYDLITTADSTGKYFYKNDLNGNYFSIVGTLYHSSEQFDIDIKVGVAYYDLWDDVFIPVTEDYFVNGCYSESSHYSPSLLADGKIYYGYIKNYTGYAYAYGTVTFYKLVPAYDMNASGNAQVQ